MATVQEVVESIQQLSAADRATIAEVIYTMQLAEVPGIESDPRVCGGDACIVRTRIPVWLLVQARRDGLTDATILRNFPTLRASDLQHAWAYAERHINEIERQIAEHDEA